MKKKKLSTFNNKKMPVQEKSFSPYKMLKSAYIMEPHSPSHTRYIICCLCSKVSSAAHIPQAAEVSERLPCFPFSMAQLPNVQKMQNGSTVKTGTRVQHKLPRRCCPKDEKSRGGGEIQGRSVFVWVDFGRWACRLVHVNIR